MSPSPASLVGPDPVKGSTDVPEISVVIVNYNGLGTVLQTIRSVLALEGVRPHLILVDDGSTDGSPEAVAREFPGVDIHREPRNTKQVNRLRNIGLSRARTDKVFVIDNDVEFERSCLAELLRAMRSDERVAMCAPRIMYSDDPSRIYIAGGRMHFAGLSIELNRDEAYDGRRAPELANGGGIALFDRVKLERVGGFDEGYALAWGDDSELHQRLLLAGYRNLYVPISVCTHEHKPFGKARYYRVRGQVANRWRYILTHHSASTLLFVAPALAYYELLQALFAAIKGVPHLYVAGCSDALRALPSILQRRTFVQSLRRVPDRAILFAGEIYVRPEHGAGGHFIGWAIRAVSRSLAVYWAAVKPLLSRSQDTVPPRIVLPPQV